MIRTGRRVIILRGRVVVRARRHHDQRDREGCHSSHARPYPTTAAKVPQTKSKPAGRARDRWWAERSSGWSADQGGVVEADVDWGADVDPGADVDADVEGDVVTGGVVGVVSGDVDVVVAVPSGDVVDGADATTWSSNADVSSPARRHTLAGPDAHTDSSRRSVISMNATPVEPRSEASRSEAS
jgi:hypothetical protein